MICMEYEATQSIHRGPNLSAKESEDSIPNEYASSANSRSFTAAHPYASSENIIEGGMIQNDKLNSNDNRPSASPKLESGRSLSEVKLHSFLQTFVVAPVFLLFTTGLFRSYTLLWGAVVAQFASLITSYKNITLGDVGEQAKCIYEKLNGQSLHESVLNSSDKATSAVDSKVDPAVDESTGTQNIEVISKRPESSGGGAAMHVCGDVETHSTCSAEVFLDDAWVCSKNEELLCAMASFDPPTSFAMEVCTVFYDASPSTFAVSYEM